VLAFIGGALLALAPAKHGMERVSATAA